MRTLTLAGGASMALASSSISQVFRIRWIRIVSLLKSAFLSEEKSPKHSDKAHLTLAFGKGLQAFFEKKKNFIKDFFYW